MMARKILIEVRLEDGESMEPGYTYNPKMVYSLVPTHSELDGSIEFTCRRSDLASLLSRMDRAGYKSQGEMTSKAIYEEPEEEAGELLKDAAHSLLGGFGAPAIDAIVDSIHEAVMPETMRKRHRRREREED